VVYPERSAKAPVVVVVHEIFGLTSWVRAVADQLAAEGFIAVAPDLLTGYPNKGNPDQVGMQDAVAQVSQLDAAQVQRRVAAAGAYAMALPAAEPATAWSASAGAGRRCGSTRCSPGRPTCRASRPA
jgi:carboxymethylenebutenolidase